MHGDDYSYYSALIKMLYYYPSIVAFYLVSKMHVFKFSHLDRIFTSLLDRFFIKKNVYLRCMTCALYVRALILYNKNFQPTWSAFKSRMAIIAD